MTSARPWYGEAPIPKGESRFFEFPFVSISTDEGIEGYTMGYGTKDEGRGNAYLLHDVYFDKSFGREFVPSRTIWQNLINQMEELVICTTPPTGFRSHYACAPDTSSAEGLPIYNRNESVSARVAR